MYASDFRKVVEPLFAGLSETMRQEAKKDRILRMLSQGIELEDAKSLADKLDKLFGKE